MKAWPLRAPRDQPAVASAAAALPAVLVGRTAGWLAECRRQLERVPEVEVRATGRCMGSPLWWESGVVAPRRRRASPISRRQLRVTRTGHQCFASMPPAPAWLLVGRLR